MTSDLALLAERRAGLAALLAVLLLEEPGPGLADLIGQVPDLAPLATGDPAIATEYERIFLRSVPLFESVFCGEDGQRGGEVLRAVVERYDQIGFTEHREGRWRVAGDDHLGMQLRCYAHLCHEEATAWRDATPDVAVRAVETERAFLADHLSRWAQFALDAVSGVAGDTPYCDLAHALTDFLVEEHERLRPGPLLGEPIEPDPLPACFGPARLTRMLLAPVSCGAWLNERTIATAARSIGSPWRASDTRSSLRHLIQTACDSRDLEVLLAPIHDAVRLATERHASRAATEPGNETTWRLWEARATAMAGLLERIISDNALSPRQQCASETVTVTGADATRLSDAIDELVDALRAQGYGVERGHKGNAVGS